MNTPTQATPKNQASTHSYPLSKPVYHVGQIQRTCHSRLAAFKSLGICAKTAKNLIKRAEMSGSGDLILLPLDDPDTALGVIRHGGQYLTAHVLLVSLDTPEECKIFISEIKKEMEESGIPGGDWIVIESRVPAYSVN